MWYFIAWPAVLCVLKECGMYKSILNKSNDFINQNRLKIADIVQTSG